VSKRVNGAAAVAPAPAKRRGGPSGTPGVHRQEQRVFRASAEVFALLDRAFAKNAALYPNGFQSWLRHAAVVTAAEELELEPVAVLRKLLPGD
jgi:hypothetical protein